MNSKPKISVQFLILGVLAIVTLSFACIWIFNRIVGPNPHLDQPNPAIAKAEAAAKREVLKAQTDQSITKAEAAAKDAVSKRAKEFHDYIAERQYRTVAGKPAVTALAEDMLSIKSKWILLNETVRIKEKGAYQEHVKGLFSKYLFSPEDLSAALKRSVDSALNDVKAIENQLAVDLEKIIAGTVTSPSSQESANTKFMVALDKVVMAGEWDGWKTLGDIGTSEVAAYVATQALLKLGVKAGAWTVEAATSWWTLGASLVIGVAVDVVWDWIDKPELDVRDGLLRTTSKLATDTMSALDKQFLEVVESRRKLWDLSTSKLLP